MVIVMPATHMRISSPQRSHLCINLKAVSVNSIFDCVLGISTYFLFYQLTCQLPLRALTVQFRTQAARSSIFCATEIRLNAGSEVHIWRF